MRNPTNFRKPINSLEHRIGHGHPQSRPHHLLSCASLNLSNAPVQARWANAQRAGPASPNPPTVACNRLLDASSGSALMSFGAVRWSRPQLRSLE